MKPSLRLLFTGVPAYGHLLPMLPLARAAIAAGHDVRFATGPDLVMPLRRRGLVAHPAGPSWARIAATAAAAAGSAAASTDDPLSRQVGDAPALFSLPVEDRLGDLVRLTADWRPDVVVHDLLELAGPVLADRLGVPSVTHGFGPLFDEYAVIGPTVADAVDPGLWARLQAAPYLDVSPQALRSETSVFPRRLALRPTAGEPGEAALPDLHWLCHTRRAYLTLGTIFHTAPGVLAETVAALKDFPLDLIVTTGPGVPPDSLGPQPRNVVVAEFLPQARVLARCSMVVSQGGAGVLLGALCHGLPQVCLPMAADQHLNAAAAERAGVAVVVPPERRTPETVRAAVDTVLSEPSYAVAARRVATEIRTLPTAAEVLPQLLAAVATSRTTGATSGAVVTDPRPAPVRVSG